MSMADLASALEAGSGKRRMVHRQRFMGQITLYMQLIMLSVFLTMNHLMSISRKAAAYKRDIQKYGGG